MEQKKSFVSRLDENVVITMLVISILACIILAFRYKSYQPCTLFTISSSAERYYTGESIRFETDAKAFKKLHWNFGDNQEDETRITSATHAYDQPGEYTVTLSTDNLCTQYKMLIISPAPKVVNPSLLKPTFECPETAEVGKPVFFKDSTAGATQWEWRFGVTPDVDATSSSFTYIYNTPGIKTVTLVVNNNPEQNTSRKILVKEATPVAQLPKPPKKTGPVIKDTPTSSGNVVVPEEVVQAYKAPDITEEELESRLRQVANKILTAESFSPYMCDNINIPINLNGTKTTFTVLCSKLGKLKNDKKIKNLKVTMIKDERNCILTLVVTFKKDGFWIF